MVEMAKLLKFSQPNCRGCTVMENVIREVDPAIQIESIDISVEKDYVKLYDLTGVPTMIILDSDGDEVARHIGTMTEEEFTEWLK